MRAEQLTDPVAYHAEGPVWSPGWGGLRWVDMLAGDILSLTESGTINRRHVGAIAAAVRPREGGGAVIAVERGLAIEGADGTVTALDEIWADPGIRMNEGGCDPDGRFYAGSMAYDQRPGAASVYRLDSDLSVRPVLDGATVSNGIDWSPDGSLAYYNDTATHSIQLFDYDAAGGLTGRRHFVTMADDDNPDGLTVDAEGGVWVAMNGSGEVRRYRDDGRLDEVIEVGARQVTACTLGGAALDELFITTSRENLNPGDDPLAGSLFHVKVGVTGMPVREFAG
ncbi:sugar lactone lactonase YvrE [Mycetocola sp. CAN_C7]|uniref:SMP-30/gluconolactonase/LRE family protein n=1 Tax=Mycetocola sp. CAN_C7 TaxID=2787724 RepID=UPI0018C92E28